MILEKIFKIKENRTNVRTEAIAGATIFLTMSYIVFVQPAVLSRCGMDFGTVMAATCIASAVSCIIMAFLANYPIAQAPAMVFCVYCVRPDRIQRHGVSLAGGPRRKSYHGLTLCYFNVLWAA